MRLDLLPCQNYCICETSKEKQKEVEETTITKRTSSIYPIKNSKYRKKNSKKFCCTSVSFTRW